MRKPTKKQAREIMQQEVIEKMQELGNELEKHTMILRLLKIGYMDDNIEISDYEKKQWHISLNDSGVSVYAFVDKFKTEEKKVPRY